MKGTKRLLYSFAKTESMHKFPIILDFQLILRGSITVRLYVHKIHNSAYSIKEGLVLTQNLNSHNCYQ